MRPRELFRQPAPGMAVPRQVKFTTDGRAVTFLAWADESNTLSLWRHELDGSGRNLLADASSIGAVDLSLDDELRRQRTRERADGITAYQRAEDSDTILALVGGRCLVSDGRSPARMLPGIDAVQAARLSPDGNRIAFVRAGDLFGACADGTQVGQVTPDAQPGVFNGLADFIAAEELDRFEGMWWGADSASLLFARVDERGVPPFVIAHLGDEQPRTEEHRYPFAGEANARVEMQIASLADDGSLRGRTTDLMDLTDAYLAGAVPHPSGGWLVARLSRDQRSLDWFRVAADGTVTELWDERCDRWINLQNDATRVLSDGRILRTTERSGFRHLELRRPDGALEGQLTHGEWVVTGIAHVDEARGEVLFLGTADGVLERQLYAVSLEAVGRPAVRPPRITFERGWHAVSFSDDGEIWADTWSTCETPPQVAIRTRSGDPILFLHQPTETASGLGIVIPELQMLPAADGTTRLHVALFQPPNPAAAPGTPPPAVVWVYGGPHSQLVRDAWDLTVNPTRQALVRAGFVVVVADSRGTANRGLAFESVLAGRLGDAEVADQAAVVEALAAQRLIDGHRVGITGASYGGYITVMAMLRRPDLFVAGVAGAPVVAWDGYDTAYTERYLGTPDSDPEAYARSSLLPRAGDLAGDLLLIHGALDENVHLRHTGRLITALHEAGRHAALVLLPDERHSPRSAGSALLIGRHTIRHLCAALGVPIPEDLVSNEGANPGDARVASPDQAAS